MDVFCGQFADKDGEILAAFEGSNNDNLQAWIDAFKARKDLPEPWVTLIYVKAVETQETNQS